MQIDLAHFGLGRQEACEVASIAESTLVGWLGKGLFREQSRGGGRHFSFDLADMTKLIAVRDLVGFGLLPKDVIACLQHGSPYGAFIHDSNKVEPPFNGPLYKVSRSQAGALIASYGSDSRAYAAVNLLPVVEEAASGIARVLRRHRPDEAGEAVEAYLAEIREHYPYFELTA